MFWVLACLDSPQTLPPPRLDQKIETRMVEYGSLKGFLVTKGEPKAAIIWKTDRITDQSKNCTIRQLSKNSLSLLIERDSDYEEAKMYLRNFQTQEKELSCPKEN